MTIRPLNSIIGQAARGDKYLPRANVTDEIWRKIESGSNLLLVAPRRVGKSSILFHLLDNPRDNMTVIYYISESVNSENEFYKKLFHHILEKMTSAKKYRAITKAFAKTLPSYIESIGPEGVKFRQGSSVNYYDELLGLMRKDTFGSERLVVLIDEFATTVENIIQDEGDRAAIHFLETKRSIRQEPGIHNKLQFVYAGSIGLENIVARINGVNIVNDLDSVNVPPLSEGEAKALAGQILDGSGITFQDSAFDHLLSTVEWWIPYYFQIILDESYKILIERDSTRITEAIIDRAVKNALQHRIYFEHWFTRLRKAYKGHEFSFIKQILNVLSETKKMPSSEIFDCALKHDLDDTYNDLVNALKHDGYINNIDNPKEYRFNSPLLREWWNANVAN